MFWWSLKAIWRASHDSVNHSLAEPLIWIGCLQPPMTQLRENRQLQELLPVFRVWLELKARFTNLRQLVGITGFPNPRVAIGPRTGFQVALGLADRLLSKLLSYCYVWAYKVYEICRGPESVC
jgi:hypothetical protein